MLWEQVNTVDEVVGYLRGAAQAVDEADLPDDLRQSAFVKAVDLLAAKMAQQQPALGGLAIPRGGF